MPRSNRPRRRKDVPRAGGIDEERPLDQALAGMPRAVSDADGDWIVRQVRGNSSGRVYRCPGCDQEVPASTPHTVAWPADDLLGDDVLNSRRHWHSSCWRARSRRAPTRRR